MGKVQLNAILKKYAQHQKDSALIPHTMFLYSGSIFMEEVCQIREESPR